ncbi:hypothetical protein HPP92_027678 [Vanilla planifolia]|uniref:Uncharacterized protein n=1 Tax=Vanilla planifolia TaxID=51239 RepID=A0A835U5L9_VANPL|nr:hypothetical protein HPP92_027678 [Vanilla planifolia]
MEKDKVMKCYEVIQDMRLVEMRSSLVSMAPQTQFWMLMWKVDFSIFTSLSDSRNLRTIEVDHKVQYNDPVDQVRP